MSEVDRVSWFRFMARLAAGLANHFIFGRKHCKLAEGERSVWLRFLIELISNNPVTKITELFLFRDVSYVVKIFIFNHLA